MDIKFKNFHYHNTLYGHLKKDNKILYDFFYKRFLCDEMTPASYRNIHGFDKTSEKENFDHRKVDGTLMHENDSQEGREFWRAFYENKMTKEQKSQLIDIIKKEMSISKSYNLWI